MVKKIIIIFIIFISSFTIKTYAEENTYNLNEIDNLSKNIMQQMDMKENDLSFSKIVDDYSKNKSIAATFKNLVDRVIKYSMSEVLSNSKLMMELLFIALMSALLENIQKSLSDDGVSKIAYYACFLSLALIIIKSFSNVMKIAGSAIDGLTKFINVMIPVLLTLLASSGGFASSAALDPVLMMVMKVVSDIIKDLILPVTMLIVILNIVDSMSDSIKVTKLAALIKQVNVWTLCFIITVFVGILTIRSSMAVTLDQVALKSTKFVSDNFIPVVGKCLSDAISTVASYSLVLKDAVSIAGLIMIVAICIFPLIKIIIIALMYKFIGAVIQPVANKKIVDCLSAVGSSLTIVFGCVLCTGLIFFIMVAMISSAGKSILMSR